MCDAPAQTQGKLESQPPLLMRLHSFIHRPALGRSPKLIHRRSASFDDALECADGNGFVAVHGDDHLLAVGVTPFLMAAFLADHRKAVLAQDLSYFLCAANWKVFAHVKATSTTLAPAGMNQATVRTIAPALPSRCARLLPHYPRQRHNPAVREKRLTSVSFPDRVPRPIAVSCSRR